MSKVVVVRCPDCGVECAVMVRRGLRGVSVRKVTACRCPA